MALASWYWQPQTLAGPATWGRAKDYLVAHKTMRFGTRVQFAYRGRSTVGIVLDRGPYVGDREWDLGPGVARALGFDGVGYVKWRVVR